MRSSFLNWWVLWSSLEVTVKAINWTVGIWDLFFLTKHVRCLLEDGDRCWKNVTIVFTLVYKNNNKEFQTCFVKNKIGCYSRSNMYDALFMYDADSCWKCYNNTLSHQKYNKEYNHLNMMILFQWIPDWTPSPSWGYSPAARLRNQSGVHFIWSWSLITLFASS